MARHGKDVKLSQRVAGGSIPAGRRRCRICERAFEPGAQRRLGRCSRLAVDDLTSPHQQERRDALHGETSRHARRGVGVHLDELHASRELVRELVQHRADHAARTAPRRPDVDQNRERPGVGNLRERAVISLRDPRQRLVTLSAAGCSASGCWHPVLATAVLALDHVHRRCHSFQRLLRSAPWNERAPARISSRRAGGRKFSGPWSPRITRTRDVSSRPSSHPEKDEEARP